MIVQPFPKQALVLTCLQYKSYENTGKRTDCSKRAISPFPTVFSTLSKNFLPFFSNVKLSSSNSYSLEVSKICCLGKGLLYRTHCTFNNPEERLKTE